MYVCESPTLTSQTFFEGLEGILRNQKYTNICSDSITFLFFCQYTIKLEPMMGLVESHYVSALCAIPEI